MADVTTHIEEQRSGTARITVIVQNRFVVDEGSTTGKRIKELAGIPPDFTLYRKAKGGNAPLADDAIVDLRNGDHFFARLTG